MAKNILVMDLQRGGVEQQSWQGLCTLQGTQRRAGINRVCVQWGPAWCKKTFSAVKQHNLCPSWLKGKSWSTLGFVLEAPAGGGLHRHHVLRCYRALLGSAFTPSSAQKLHSFRDFVLHGCKQQLPRGSQLRLHFPQEFSLKCSALWGKAKSLTGRDPVELGTDFQPPRDKAVSFPLSHTPLFTKPPFPPTAFCGITDWTFHQTMSNTIEVPKDAVLNQILKIWSSTWIITCCAFR